MSLLDLLQMDVLDVFRQAPAQTNPAEPDALEFLSVLGKGAHGTVHLARRRGAFGFEKLVAVKVLTHVNEDDAHLVERFLHEARLLGMLRHRSIVAADDLLAVKGQPALVMEYVEGHDLSAVAATARREPGVVPLAWLAHVGMEVTSALQAAWESLNPLTGQPLRALHCDVKPSNVRISASGSVKLLDFGVAQSQSREEGLGVIAGTRAFLPPERWQGAVASPSSDLFALGVTLLALTGCADPRSRPTGAAESQAWVERALANLPRDCRPLRSVLGPLLDSDPSVRPDHQELLEQLHTLTRTDGRRRRLLHESLLKKVDGLVPLADAPTQTSPSGLPSSSSLPQAVPLGLRAADADDDTAAWSALDVAAVGLFQGPFTLETAAALLADTPQAAAQSLQRLLDTGELLRTEEDGVPLLRAAQPAAARAVLESLAPADRAALQQRHAEHFDAVANIQWLREVRAGVGPPPAVLDAVLAELQAAAEAPVDPALSVSLQLALAVSAQGLFFEERMARLESLVAHPACRGPLWARIVGWQCFFAIAANRSHALSPATLHAAIDEAVAHDDPATAGEVWHYIACSSTETQPMSVIRAAFEEAERLAYLADSGFLLAACANNLGTALLRSGDIEGGMGPLERAREMSQRSGSHGLEIMALNNLSVSWLYLGRPVKAMRTADRAVRVAQRRASPMLVAFSLMTRGSVSFADGDWEEAAEDYDEAVGPLLEAGHGHAAAALVLRARARGRAGLATQEQVDADLAQAQVLSAKSQQQVSLFVQLTHALVRCEQGRAAEGVDAWRDACRSLAVIPHISPPLRQLAREARVAFAEAGFPD